MKMMTVPVASSAASAAVTPSMAKRPLMISGALPAKPRTSVTNRGGQNKCQKRWWQWCCHSALNDRVLWCNLVTTPHRCMTPNQWLTSWHWLTVVLHLLYKTENNGTVNKGFVPNPFLGTGHSILWSADQFQVNDNFPQIIQASHFQDRGLEAGYMSV